MQSVELRIIGNPGGIDLKMPLPRRGEEAAVAGIADQFLVSGFQLAVQAGERVSRTAASRRASAGLKQIT
jgi:hypothetical protein